MDQVNSGKMARVFFALCPDERCADKLQLIAARLTTQLGGRAMRKETLHLTLVFVGNVSENSLSDLLAIATETAEEFRGLETEQQKSAPFRGPLHLTLDHLGYWPHKRILWIGSHHCPPWLAGLADLLAKKLRPWGYSIPARPLAPHITLARNMKLAPEITELDAIENAMVAGPVALPIFWPCHDFFLLRSRHTEAGQVYEKIDKWPLELLRF